MAWPTLEPAGAQEVAPMPAEKPAEKIPQKQAESKDAKSEKAELPFQIQLLETHVRFETNGDSRKEVHTIVKINNVLGAREFSRLTFDYNRGWQQVEIPLVRVSHANGGTSELLPSAVTDAPDAAVEKFPAYQDVRVKSARILGLQEGDTVEYRVITTSTKPPLAPEFWLEHTFDRSGQVLEENYELDLPTGRDAGSVPIGEPGFPIGNERIPGIARMHLGPDTPPPSREVDGQGDGARTSYRWKISADSVRHESQTTQKDLIVSTFASWKHVDAGIGPKFMPYVTPSEFNEMVGRSTELEAHIPSGKPLEAAYAFVSEKIRTVDLPLGATGFRLRDPLEVLSSGYGTPEDKVRLFAALARAQYGTYFVVLAGDLEPRPPLPIPSEFTHVLIQVPDGQTTYYLDPSLEVAPYGVIPPEFRAKPGFMLQEVYSGDESRWWIQIPNTLPFDSKQSVVVDASLSREGALTSTVKYVMRGDNELLLREAFHGTAKEKWKDVANLLAISDGFRGEITSVNVSDPLATREPFQVEYTITQAKFVDWSKKPVRIPALLPQIGLPDLPRKVADGGAAPKIELGTPLDVETQMTLKLPAETKAVVPPGTAVNRDYARFSSKYGTSTGAGGETVTASRRVNFLLREIEGTRGLDYNAFVRAVQNDQAGMIVLEREAGEKIEEKKKKD
jgi:hypothetical protein